jgi:RNA polymerase sigma factor (sigma-70 family)
MIPKNKQIELASLYEKYSDILFSYASSMNFEDEMIMDAIHDVFLKICITPDIILKINNHKYYLLKTLKNRLVNIYHSQKLSLNTNQYRKNLDQLPFNIQISIEDELIAREERDQVVALLEKILNQLTPRQRKIVYLKYKKEYSYKDIASIMDMSVEASRNLMNRAMRKCKRLFKKVIIN